ncbi:acyl carrier protein phosphodiesterase [Zunongwangia endophytica]|uniref:Acyl carrier protein phosphodiesterase n=1 Tax=Zunongwangia endophytica TaxID=1808945 RepID=A0ABV8H9A1_9FLAO|nr:acyl carrier protein phosphodiesterase [Zunongwangia endophytica]MDN3593641.1 acyl carrier protein phosphodiesterase [Zunongwangia endophytica]
MNYLAHIYLSGENDMLKIGNFIADSVKGKQYLDYPETVQKGITLHRNIDEFTDAHPIVHQSVRRLFEKYSHYSTVIVDILYDHFLAANWQDFHNTKLENYSSDFYKLIQNNIEVLPKRVKNFMPYMIEHDWLVTYSTIDGIGLILSQMNKRTKFRSKMGESVHELREFYEEFKDEFYRFFAELEVFAEKRKKELLQ